MKQTTVKDSVYLSEVRGDEDYAGKIRVSFLYEKKFRSIENYRHELQVLKNCIQDGDHTAVLEIIEYGSDTPKIELETDEILYGEGGV